MHAARSFAQAAIVMTFCYMSAPVQGGMVLLTNLDQPLQDALPNPFVGQSFLAGDVSQVLYGAQMQLDMNSHPSFGISLEVEARDFDGTVGATLFSDFSSSFDTSTGLITFTANSSFVLTAGTGYWLVLSDANVGGVTWDFTASNSYQSALGFGLPSFNTSWISDQDNGSGNSTYYQPSDGPQLFSLIAPSVIPEPPSCILLCSAGLMLGFASWLRGAG